MAHTDTPTFEIKSLVALRNAKKNALPMQGAAECNLLLWITRGHGAVTLAGQTRPITPNALIFVPKGASYNFKYGNDCFGMVLIADGQRSDLTPETPLYLTVRHIADQTRITTTLDLVQKEFDEADTFSNGAIAAYFDLLIVMVNRLARSLEVPTQKTSQAKLMERFAGLVEEHCQSGETLSFYAEKLNVTTQHLTRVCRQENGSSASEYLQSRVLDEAKNMLDETDLKVNEISARLKFSSAAYFSRFFTQRIGLSPAEYRRAHA